MLITKEQAEAAELRAQKARVEIPKILAARTVPMDNAVYFTAQAYNRQIKCWFELARFGESGAVLSYLDLLHKNNPNQLYGLWQMIGDHKELIETVGEIYKEIKTI
jgi:hypothetical protein